MNFTSQICTTEEQSKRLLALGLKKETADMHYYHTVDFEGNEVWYPSIIPYENVVVASDFVGETEICLENNTIPAWSLDRLIEMMPSFIDIGDFAYMLKIIQGKLFSYHSNIAGHALLYGKGSVYESAIYTIECLIKGGYFNKEYLEE